ncbi:hypothetical protein KEM56_001005 [Ascosphaera pollenicola]|nr:hypothetical protein KEM56_001005 [Ascosphaera pollenicola]
MTITPERKPDSYRYGVPIYKYIDIPETEATVTQILEPLDQGVYEVIFTDVPPNVIEEVFTPFGEGELRLQMPVKTYLDSFDKAKRIMTFRRFVLGHQAADGHDAFVITSEINLSMRKNLINRHMVTTTRTRVPITRGGYIRPSHAPEARFEYPQIILEVGTSESIRGLAQDAKHWLTQSAGNVKLMLTSDVSGHMAFLESWVKDSNKTRIESSIIATADDAWNWRQHGETKEIRIPIRRVLSLEPIKDYEEEFVITFDMHSPR